jgi:hypothetical protein
MFVLVYHKLYVTLTCSWTILDPGIDTNKQLNYYFCFLCSFAIETDVHFFPLTITANICSKNLDCRNKIKFLSLSPPASKFALMKYEEGKARSSRMGGSRCTRCDKLMTFTKLISTAADQI